MDKVRFGIGPHVFQGFHDKDDHGMAGALVFVTADTLRQVTGMLHDEMSSDFDRLHNAPTEDWATLAFGDTGTIVAPDGITPLYRLACAEPSIVQRFNPEGGRTYDRHFGEGNVEKVPYGVWENEETLDGFFVRQDEWTPICHGFVIDAAGWIDGRGDAPPIDTERAVAERQEAAVVREGFGNIGHYPNDGIEGNEYVVDVLVPIAIAVRADNEEMAASMALESLENEGVRARIQAMVDSDDSSFTISDSEAQTEVGEA